MEERPADGWEVELGRWLEPFLVRLRRQAQRHWAPFYLKGLILPGERKSIEPMAARVAPGDIQQLHHFVSTSPWPTAPLEEELVKAADRLLGGPDAVLVVDDTALVKQGRHSVGVKRQYCGQLGKRANCQSQGKRMNACSCALADEALEVDRVPPRALPAVLERGCGLGLVQQVQGHVPDHGHVLRRMAGAQA